MPKNLTIVGMGSGVVHGLGGGEGPSGNHAFHQHFRGHLPENAKIYPFFYICLKFLLLKKLVITYDIYEQV